MGSVLEKEPDQIVITLSPSEYSEQGYRNSYLRVVENLVSKSAEMAVSPEVVFISSSSVYSENQGNWVDEDTEPKPQRYNGKVLLEAETTLTYSHLPSTCIRFSGIYGPGRYRLISSALNNSLKPADARHWTNRIHADDCAAVIQHILQLPLQKRKDLYLASDSAPVYKAEVQNWIRAQFGQPASTSELSNTPQSGKRCRNNRLLESGYQFLYPTYKEGFPEILMQYKKRLS